MSLPACRRVAFSALAAIVWAVGSATVSFACPICGQPTVTLSERLARADAALLVEWVSTRPFAEGEPDTTTYEIVQVSRGEAEEFPTGTRLTVEGYHEGKAGNLVFLLGNKTDAGEIRWDHPPLDISETAFQYVIQAPSPETPRAKRLEYFVRFLEYPDITIANDAFAEFVNAPASDIAAVASRLSREKLRKWLADEKTPINRQAAFGMMLGLCGKPEDADLLERRILDTSGERRPGIEGLMVGYMMLRGEKGLEVLERTKLRAPITEDGEKYPAQIAIRYFWSYGNNRIPRSRLEAATRILLDDPRFFATATVDLGRWKDWSIQPRLMKTYGQLGVDDKIAKEAIIRYMIASTKDVPKAVGQKLPDHAVRGAEYLRQLRMRDPELVDDTEKHFYMDAK
jgi:hypothetical protein